MSTLVGHGRVGILASFTLAVLLLASMPSTARTPGHWATVAVGPIGTTSFPEVPPPDVHPPGLGERGPLASGPPAATQVWYTREGATLSQFNRSTSQTGVGSLAVDVPLVPSPYPIGYELNGLTDTGDSYRVGVGADWPGCPGYTTITQVSDRLGTAGPLACDSSTSMVAGDVIRLGLNLSGSTGVCMRLTDLTRGTSVIVCHAQPSPGATEFVTLPTRSDANGYFTGPLTEVANTSASACPDYTFMPLVAYNWPPGFGVSAYVPWSDEFEATTSIACYSDAAGRLSPPAGSPQTIYFDTAQSTPYGPHWVAGQLFSLVNSTYGFRIQTDPVPLTNVSINASAAIIPVGGNVTLTVTVTGGEGPYTALWYLNDTYLGPGGTQRTWNGTAAGVYHFSAYGVDRNFDVIRPLTEAVVQVNGPLAVPPISTTVASGNADVGEAIRFTATPVGGMPPYSFAWHGLPAECPAGNVGSVLCVPTAAANYSVDVTVADANASAVTSAPHAFRVSPPPSVDLAPSATELDIGQTLSLLARLSGGSGGPSFAWAGLPPACLPTPGPELTCTVSSAGAFSPGLTVTDTNGVAATSPAVSIRIFAAPSLLLTANRALADVGVSVTFYAVPIGGSGGFTILWSGLPSECSSANSTIISCAPTAAGVLTVAANATDTVGGSATSPTVGITVFPPLQLALTGPAEVAVGAALEAIANVSGGSPGVSYRWSGLPPGCIDPATSRLNCVPTGNGEFDLSVTATDSGGGMSAATLHVAIEFPPASGSPSLLGVAIVVWAAIAVAIILTVGAVVYFSRNRR